MSSIPILVEAIFILTTLATAVLFWMAVPRKRLVGVLLIGWLLLQSAISASGFYTVSDSLPPRFLLLPLPPLLTIIFLFAIRDGKDFIRQSEAGLLTLLHTVRIPVELVLYQLFLCKAVPQLMTFEGRNFDIFSGITAPLVYYFGYKKRVLPKQMLLAWNVICLLLLLNIVTNAVLSTPVSFQQFAFDQPNIAVLHFPFSLLPGCVVPLVLFSHLTCCYQQLRQKPKTVVP